MVNNFGLLLGGRVTSAIIGFAATALSARGLPPEIFGKIVLIHTYVLLFHGLFNLNSFEAIVRYGVQSEDRETRRRLICGFFHLDLAGALLGFFCAVALAPLIGGLLGWSGEEVRIAVIYSSVIALSPVAALTGLLRMYDRFDLLAMQGAVRQVVRLVGVALAFFYHASPIWYLVAWYAGLLVEQIWLLFWGWIEMRRQLGSMTLFRRGVLRFAGGHPGIWRFSAGAYGQSLVDLANKQLITIIAGGLLGAEAAGLFRLAREFSKIVARPVSIVREAILPDMSRLWHSGSDAFTKLMLKACLYISIPAILLWAAIHLFGRELLIAVAGAPYGAASLVLSLLIAAAALDLIASPLRPAAFAMGHSIVVFLLNLVALAVFLLLAMILSPIIGLAGPGVGALVSALVSLVGLGLCLTYWLRRDGLHSATV